MTSKIKICKACSRAIHACGGIAFEAYTTICVMDSQGFCYAEECRHGKGSPVLQFLEKKGLVITTEISPTEIGVSPSVRYPSGEKVYCGCEKRAGRADQPQTKGVYYE